ncbi:MAG: DUF4153 domain-containing protein [Tissierellaceae bacterium]|nr:DUF4153 domain-containing protein [Tissierellaceae bacterium]
MKILRRIKSTFLSIRKSIKRFPITVLISTVLALSLIYLNEVEVDVDTLDKLIRLNMVLGLSILLSLCIGLFVEITFSHNRLISTMLYLGGGAFLVFYYNFYLQNLNTAAVSRYFGLVIFFILAFLYIPRLREKDDYEYYILDVYYGFALTVTYALVLFIGLSAIFLTINQLFEVEIPGKLYYYIFLILSLVFAVSLFLANLPSVEEKYKNAQYNKSLRVLLTFIVIPLISIYSAILYVYFAKILLIREWPKGLVSHLVIWYSTVSVGVIFLLNPIINSNKVANTFKKIFPKAVLPILLMMFISIFQRIFQYGITENRYYIVVLGFWVLGIMIYFSAKRNYNNAIIPISLSLLVLVSVFGPFSSFAISKYSQNKRLQEILVRNSMLVNGTIIPNADVSQEHKKEISNIINYFSQNHELGDIKILPDGFAVDDMENVMGFKYIPYNLDPYERDRYFYFATNSQEPIDINDFQYYLNMNSWDEELKEIGGYTISYNREKSILTVRGNGEEILQQDLRVFVKEIYAKENMGIDIKKNFLDMEDMTFEFSYIDSAKVIKFKIIFLSVNGRVEGDNNIMLEGVDYILLMGKTE